MRGGVLQLSRWGLLDEIIAAGTPPVKRTTFRYGDESCRHQRQTVTRVSTRSTLHVAPCSTLCSCVRRSTPASTCITALGDRPDHARRSGGRGARHHLGRTVRRSRRTAGDRRRRHPLDHRGRASARRSPELGVHVGAVTYAYWSDLTTDGYEWNFRPNGCSGVIPTNNGQACVFASASPERIGRGGVALIGDVVAEGSPELAERLRKASPPRGTRTWNGHRGYIRRSYGPGWALVGDAGYFKDPISAHGLTDALRDAELLARAVIDGFGDDSSLDDALEHYETTRDRLSIPLFDVVDRIAGQQWDDAEIAELLLQLSSAMVRRSRHARRPRIGPRVMSRRTLLGVWAHPDDDPHKSVDLMVPDRRVARVHGPRPTGPI